MSGLDLTAAAASVLALGAARRFRWLSVPGMLAAAGIGATLWLAAGAAFLLMLLVFFATSSALSRSLDAQPLAATGRSGRTAVQVLANGGVATLAGLAGLAGLLPGAQFAVAGALAAAMSDTWPSRRAPWRERRRARTAPRTRGFSEGA